MDRNIFWFFFSFAYIGLLALLGLVFYQCLHMKNESVRKFIHIFTSNWVFIVFYGMDSPFWMLLGPFLFIIINTVFIYGGFGSFLGMDDRKRDNGLIYYPISLFFLIVLNLSGYIEEQNVIAGILIMGWGDGLAAFIGTLLGHHSYRVFSRYKKSVEGTVTMMFVSLAVILLSTSTPWYFAIVVALIASILENVTPLGIDNITVPIISSILLEAICRL